MHEHQPTATTDEENVRTTGQLSERLAQAIEESPPAPLPRIWAGSISDYLAGQPVGRWIQASVSQRHLAEEVNTMLARAPEAPTDEIPTWGIFAFEGFGRHEPSASASASLVGIVQAAQAAANESRAFSAWARLDPHSREHQHRFAGSYQGRYDSLHDWVTVQVEAAGYDQLLDERLPGHLRPFVDINIEALAHDMTTGGEVLAIADPNDGGVWIFTPPPKRCTEEGASPTYSKVDVKSTNCLVKQTIRNKIGTECDALP